MFPINQCRSLREKEKRKQIEKGDTFHRNNDIRLLLFDKSIKTPHSSKKPSKPLWTSGIELIQLNFFWYCITALCSMVQAKNLNGMIVLRSEERRVGKECRSAVWPV